LTQDIGFVWGPSHPGLGGVRDRGGEGEFSMIGRCSSGVFEAHPGTPVPSARYPRSLRLEVNIPGIVRVPIKVIVVYGELRETIQGVSGLLRTVLVEGRWGMGLGNGW